MKKKEETKKLEAALIQIYEEILANLPNDESPAIIKQGMKIIPTKPDENVRFRAFTNPANKDKAPITNFTAEELTYLALKEKKNNIPYNNRIYTALIIKL